MINDFRLRIRHFYRRNKKIIFIAISVIVIIYMVNLYLKFRKPEYTPQTTYEPHTSVIDSSDKVSKSVSLTIEDMIKQYMDYCNDANWAEAYNMLSEDCKKYAFNNSLSEYMQYVYTKMPTEKKYAIQDYSNDGDLYIYQIKYTDDYLATGLTNSVYQFREEKIVFKKLKNGEYEMAVGNYIDHHELKNVFENDYIKVDLKNVTRFYSMETYDLKITNRTDKTIVIANNVEDKEVTLKLKSGDLRHRLDIVKQIVLEPEASILTTFKFQKFYDNDDDSESIVFNSIRVLEEYNGISTDLENDEQITNEQNIEEQNSIAKFSMDLPIKFKD